VEEDIADATIDNDIPGGQQWVEREHNQIGLRRDGSEQMDGAEILSRA
jgi:hypothetical protein